ncbi:MAG: ABC-2 type transport system permease protein [Pirellulaceae bacterium]|jgi:ABC-2 type transport system permease protein
MVGPTSESLSESLGDAFGDSFSAGKQVEPNVVTVNPLTVVLMLAWREIIRFFRQRNRVIGAVGQPIIFWLLFGTGLHGTFRLTPTGEGGQSFLDYYLPGTLVLILLFTAIFATISIIEDRKEGFLQSVLVAPIPRWTMVLGKILGGSVIAVAQGLLFLALALCIRMEVDVSAVAQITAMLAVAAIGLTSLGFVIAWRMESTQGFHAIMNLALMPMWLLSGAFFPPPALVAGLPIGQVILHWTMRLNPVSYCVAGIRHMLDSTPLAGFWVPSLPECWLVTCVAALLAFGGAWMIAGQRTSGDLL